MIESSDCASCGAPIVRAITASGKRAAFDAQPVYRGRFYPDERVGRFVYDPLRSEHGYLGHYATCTSAAAVAWRKARNVPEP